MVVVIIVELCCPLSPSRLCRPLSLSRLWRLHRPYKLLIVVLVVGLPLLCRGRRGRPSSLGRRRHVLWRAVVVRALPPRPLLGGSTSGLLLGGYKWPRLRLPYYKMLIVVLVPVPSTAVVFRVASSRPLAAVIVRASSPARGCWQRCFCGGMRTAEFFIMAIVKNDVFRARASDLTAGEALTINRAMLEHHPRNS